MNNGKNKTKGRLKKCRKEKEKEGRSQEVATTAASGDIPPETAHHKEKGSKEDVTCVERRDIQPHTVRKAAEKGSQKEKEKHKLGGTGERKGRNKGRELRGRMDGG